MGEVRGEEIMEGQYLSRGNLAARKKLVESIVAPIVRGRRDRTIAAIYARSMPDSGGKLRTALAVDTASGRLSSSESLVYPRSSNLQNMPKKIARFDPLYQVRDIFIAPKGFALLSIDYAGAESVCVAAYSKDWEYLEALLRGEDTHSMHAKLFFGEAWDKADPSSKKLMRDIAKSVTYASYYGATVPTIARTINQDSDFTGISLSEGEVAKYHRILLSVRRLEMWWEETKEELKRNDGVLRNCFGYRRRFHSIDEHSRMKDALSFFPQSTVAWLMLENMLAADTLERKYKVQLLLQVHDELLFQAPLSNKTATVNFIKELDNYMRRTFIVNGREVYIPTEWKIGNSWGKMVSLREPYIEHINEALDSQRA